MYKKQRDGQDHRNTKQGPYVCNIVNRLLPLCFCSTLEAAAIVVCPLSLGAGTGIATNHTQLQLQTATIGGSIYAVTPSYSALVNFGCNTQLQEVTRPALHFRQHRCQPAIVKCVACSVDGPKQRHKDRRPTVVLGPALAHSAHTHIKGLCCCVCCVLDFLACCFPAATFASSSW